VARVKRAVHSRKHRRSVLEAARGYYGNKSRSYRAAHEQVMHSLQYAFRDRRARKGDFRRLWVQRVNAACRAHGSTYSRFIAGLKAAGAEVDRKILADLAVRDDTAFAHLVTLAEGALGSSTGPTRPSSPTGQVAPPAPAVPAPAVPAPGPTSAPGGEAGVAPVAARKSRPPKAKAAAQEA